MQGKQHASRAGTFLLVTWVIIAALIAAVFVIAAWTGGANDWGADAPRDWGRKGFGTPVEESAIVRGP